MMLQKRFVDQEGRLCAFNKTVPNGSVFATHPGKLFIKSHLYSSLGRDGVRNTAMEQWFSALEGKADRVIEKIVTAARAAQTPELNAEEVENWLRFFMLQWKRVPDLHLTVTTEAEVNADFEALVAKLRLVFPLRSKELEEYSRPDVRQRMIQNARVGILSAPADDVMEALHSRGIAVARILRSDKQFVLASRPVIKLTHPGKSDVRHPECEMWLAVAPDVIVGLGRGAGRVDLFDIPDTGTVRHHNLASVQQSTMFASASRTLVESLARPR
jgi:hypothetical protein